MMKTALAMLCLTVGVQGELMATTAKTNCIGFLDSLADAFVSHGDFSVMNTLVDEEKFVGYVLPASMGASLDGYNLTAYQELTNRLVSLDYFTTFEVVKLREYHSTSGVGCNRKYTCNVLGYSVAVTESGRNYGQNYSLTVEMDSLAKVTAYYEHADSLYSLCFYQILPSAVCAALGL